MPPLNLLIKPASGNCNITCKYCFYRDVENNREVKSTCVMLPVTHENMVRAALRYAEKYCSFAFQGGEPTLAGLEFYKRHVILAKNYNVHNVKVNHTLQTNGMVIDDKWAEFFKKNDFLIGLSLDGYREIHNLYRKNRGEDTFDKVMNTVKLFQKHRVEFNILCVVNKSVAQNAKTVYEFYKKNDLRNLQFIPCLDDFNNDEPREFSLTADDYGEFLINIFDLYYEDFKKGNYISIRNFDNYIMMFLGKPPESCGMSGFCNSYLVVDGDGSVYPCDYYVLEKWRMGNINLQTPEQLSNSYAAKEFVRVSRPIDAKCKRCYFFQICRGGCRRNRDNNCSDKLHLNIYCDAYKKFFSHSIEKMQEMASIAASKQKGRKTV